MLCVLEIFVAAGPARGLQGSNCNLTTGDFRGFCFLSLLNITQKKAPNGTNTGPWSPCIFLTSQPPQGGGTLNGLIHGVVITPINGLIKGGLPFHHLKQAFKNWVETLNHQGFLNLAIFRTLGLILSCNGWCGHGGPRLIKG